ncbi:MAG: DEAD/DEAH box helicase family protein [Anaerolineae bacterium]|nr:DEAD/DEAH box helicase family protein [Anaerolineae bacterium]
MIYFLIQSKKNAWVQSDTCPARGLLDYIRQCGQLWDDQIEAIEIYLFLKIAAGNKPLAVLFAEGFFFGDIDLDELRLSAAARATLENNTAARSLFQFASLPVNGRPLLPGLEKAITENVPIDYQKVIDAIFYNVDYPDYLFSLPMGGGKTFLIAALIYLDLYFAYNEPDNPAFGHNFIVLVPSGLKSSVLPSLKDIEHFDPSWVLPEPAASEIKRQLRFEVLDQPKAAKKSNRARNPNAQKVNLLISQPTPMGLVFVVNAEKVILDRLELGAQMDLIEKTDDERDRAANELRHLVGKIPNLAIHIDEVHHATNEDIKLRRVVNQWSKQGTVRTVLGYSGTPYLPAPEKIPVGEDVQLQFKQIANTVYYYPLVRAISRFLKKPKIQAASNLPPLEIIRRGVAEFYELYGDTVYQNGARAKLVIYCGTIERLEEEVYPFLVNEMGISPDDILKFHKGNKQYKLPRQNETEFASLDLPVSQKRVVLLVQVGKEGWNCRSLTGVILAQKGDSPTNMVLQTTCRCLRQVDKGASETALIWLNSDNQKTLDKQLKEEQRTSIAEINAMGKGDGQAMVKRHSRLAALKLPPIDFYQLRIEYETIVAETDPRTEARLSELLANIEEYRTRAQIQSGELVGTTTAQVAFTRASVVEALEGEAMRFDFWLAEIAKESFGALTLARLRPYADMLEKIFDAVTQAPEVLETSEALPVLNELYDQEQVRAQIRLAFAPKRTLNTRQEVVPKKAELLLAAKLDAVTQHDKLYPNAQDAALILKADASGATVAQIEQQREEMLKAARAMAASSLLGDMMVPQAPPISLAVRSKDKTFHYLPYDFRQSGFELGFLQKCLTLDVFQDRRLEIYYNGERGLTEFVIECFANVNGFWRRLGKYTTDFLIIQRDEQRAIHKVLLVETKGAIYANDPTFLKKKGFVETEFLRLNRDKFGYDRFEFLFLRDEDPEETNVALLSAKVEAFFN